MKPLTYQLFWAMQELGPDVILGVMSDVCRMHADAEREAGRDVEALEWEKQSGVMIGAKKESSKRRRKEVSL